MCAAAWSQARKAQAAGRIGKQIHKYVGKVSVLRKGKVPVDYFSIASWDVVDELTQGATDAERTDGGVMSIQSNETVAMLAPPYDFHARKKTDELLEPTDGFVTGHVVTLLEKEKDGELVVETGTDDAAFDYSEAQMRAVRFAMCGCWGCWMQAIDGVSGDRDVRPGGRDDVDDVDRWSDDVARGESFGFESAAYSRTRTRDSDSDTGTLLNYTACREPPWRQAQSGPPKRTG